MHRWVHEKIEFAGDMENVQTCMKTLQVHRGVCAEMNSLTVAMLRSEGFPARLVRIPGHCYYEVYLLAGDGRGHWLAGDASRDATITPGNAIAGMILQKGDNVTIIDPVTKRRTKGRFLSDTVVGPPQSAAAKLLLRGDQSGDEGQAEAERRGGLSGITRPASETLRLLVFRVPTLEVHSGLGVGIIGQAVVAAGEDLVEDLRGGGVINAVAVLNPRHCSWHLSHVPSWMTASIRSWKSCFRWSRLRPNFITSGAAAGWAATPGRGSSPESLTAMAITPNSTTAAPRPPRM